MALIEVTAIKPRVSDEAFLGLASTKDLFKELLTRFEISTPNHKARASIVMAIGACRPGELDYRTVDS